MSASKNKSKGGRRTITKETWEKLVQAFREEPGVWAHASRAAGVDRRTATKAWYSGCEKVYDAEEDKYHREGPIKETIGFEGPTISAEKEAQKRATVVKRAQTRKKTKDYQLAPDKAKLILFAQEFIKDLDEKAAATRAGIKISKAKQAYNDPIVKAEIARLLKETAERSKVSVDRVIQLLLAGINKAFQLNQMTAYLGLVRLLGQHLGMFAEKIEHTGAEGGPIVLAAANPPLSVDELKRRYQIAKESIEDAFVDQDGSPPPTNGSNGGSKPPSGWKVAA
jgi:hypothetical protein